MAFVAVVGAACSRGGPAPPSAAASDGSAASVTTDAARPAVSADAAADAPEPDDEATDPLEKSARKFWNAEGRPDIVYVPTPQKIVDHMLAVAKIKKTDLLYDLGCGDGRILVTAAKRYGVHAVGFDIDPKRVAEARENVRANGLEDLVTVRWADIMMVDLSPATVVTMYLSPKLQETLVHHTEMMAPGSRVVTHDYALSDAIPTARWSMQAPFFGNMNQLWEAGVPEDQAHYDFVQHYVFLYVTPVRYPKE
jgi:precorrin-6B methylase 2